MADPRAAFAASPKRQVDLDLEHVAIGPMYGGHTSGDAAEQQFAKAHYEQHMAVRGVLRIAAGDGANPEPAAEIEIDGFGLRDHSWGPRTWQALHSYEWLTMNFGPDLGAMVSIIRRTPEDVRCHGVLIRGMQLETLTEVSITAEYEANGLYHRSVVAELRTASGEEHRITGEVRGFIPLRNRRDGHVTHIGEGMTEWRWGDRIGSGLSEFLRQVS